MGERLTLRVFRGLTEDQFRPEWEKALLGVGGRVTWDTKPESGSRDFRTAGRGPVQTIFISDRSGAEFLFCRRFAQSLELPWLELRVSEGSLWDYSLYRGAENIDNFSTLPQYWGDDPESWADRSGDPELLARTFAVEPQRIERYIRNWGYEEDDDEGTFLTQLRGKAYPGDKHEYGDIWQLYDFLHALGGADPMNALETGKWHSLELPPADRLR